jgi:hypothetical protein
MNYLDFGEVAELGIMWMGQWKRAEVVEWT